MLITAMNRQTFLECFEKLRPKQKEVLWLFLDYADDQSIADALYCSRCNVRYHISKICKVFGFTNDEGEAYCYRHDLVEVFLQHMPERVSPQWQAKLLDRPLEELEFPGRPLRVNSRYYLERPPAETRTSKVSKPGELVRIRGPRKTGKTSLLNRTLYEAKEQGYFIAAVKLYQADVGVMADPRRFLQWFCIQISEAVELPIKIEDYWSDLVGDASSCSRYLQYHILNQLNAPLIVGIDEVDRLFEHPQTAHMFFALLRGWFEEARTQEVWGKFRQIIVYATDEYIEFNLNRSPLNVGIPVKLQNFKAQEVLDLAYRYGFKQFSEANAQALKGLVGGHPHLVQLALYHLHEGWTLPEVLTKATSQTGIYANHLQTLTDKLLDHPELAAAFQEVVSAGGNSVCLPQKPAKQLEGLGLVTRQDTAVTISCQLYQKYFLVHRVDESSVA